MKICDKETAYEKRKKQENTCECLIAQNPHYPDPFEEAAIKEFKKIFYVGFCFFFPAIPVSL